MRIILTHRYRGAAMSETWKELSWAPFLVSDRGRVARILDLQNDPRGYKAATFPSDEVPCGRKRRYVHQLVAEAFLPEPPGPIGRAMDEWQVHHKNNDPSDNRAVNLEYLRRDTHETYSLDGKARGEDHGASKLTEDDVREIRSRYRSEDVTYRELADEYDVHRVTIGQVVRREIWAHVK